MAMEEQREALLQKHYFENCPGCKVEKLKESQRGLPIRELLSIWIVVLSSSLPISSLYPFLYFMIRDFHIATREEDIGYYAGWVGCSFLFGRALTSIFWGIVADRYGRKPVIIIGIAVVVIFNTLFGLSVNFWMAIVVRFLLGSLNGLLGPIKAYASEIFREEYQALGVSTVSAAWGIGLVIGPALGGYLAQPAEKFPSIFSKESVFGKFPYFLPCLTMSLFALVVSIGSFWLPETLHMHHGIGELDESRKDAETSSLESGVKCKTEKVKGKAPKKSLIRNWPLMSTIIAYCVFALYDTAYSEIFSLWAESPRRLGGLSYTTEDVGTVLSISGAGLLVIQTFIYPYLDRLLGPVWVARICGILSIPLLSSYPFIAMLTGLSLSIVLNCASVAENALSLTILTSLFLLQNKAVDQDQRGAANGISMTAISLFKAAGPGGGGAIFSWTQKRQDAAFLPGNQMIFFILNVIGAIGVLMMFKPFRPAPQLKESRIEPA
ncbi:hypothetical protein ACJRO7_028670 [Eucalyptus globulus]|uniref:Major facilitator superfamily (MFS) profile domain-containing protein n=1 Tax=Eucalyptus globulus TaxID=34317 RepID=A0ABD3K183_EUCGL